MKLKSYKIEDIKPYKNNPRNNDNAVDYVAKSIQEFGFKVPIIIDKNNVIVAGHTRVKAAKKLGITEVPCIIADDLTEEQVKAFRLADNKAAEKSEWDFTLLENELEQLSNIQMQEFGFLDIEQINWDNVKELKEESYDEPEKEKFQCPCCGHVDSKVHFKKVK